MPILVATYLLQFACAAHALRRGASYPVIFLIVAFPFLGCAVYVFAVILPEFLGSKTARDAAESVKDTVAPQRHLERYADNLEIADTVENKLKLADELCRKGNPAAAIPLYQKCLDGPFADNPDIHLRLAMAAFDAGKPGETVTVLDQLIAQNSDYRSQDAHLLYARALEALGNDQRAAQEYENLCGYFSGPEAKCRYGLFLKSHGRGDEARQQFRDVLQGAKHAQPHVRKRHREWIDLARGETG